MEAFFSKCAVLEFIPTIWLKKDYTTESYKILEIFCNIFLPSIS